MEFNVNDYVSGFVRNLVNAAIDKQTEDEEVAIGQLKYPQLWPVLERGDVEVWVPAVGFEDNYIVSSWGNVRRSKLDRYNKGENMRISTMENGYKTIGLRLNGKASQPHRIHRLVKLSFYDNPNPPLLTTVEHDDDKAQSNNRLDNLLFASLKYQLQSCNRKPNPKSSATKQVRPVKMLDLNGKFLMRHASMMDAARWLQNNGFTTASTSLIIKAADGKIPTGYGYKWERDDVIENLPDEVWKQVQGDVLPTTGNGPYLASTMGRLQNKHGELIDGSVSNGYIIVINNIRMNRLIAATFCENDDPDTKIEVKHLNNHKLDNRASNLMWDIHQVNAQEAHDDGLVDKSRSCQKVKVTNTDTNEWIIYNRVKDVLKAYGISHDSINRRFNDGKTMKGQPYIFERVK